VDDHNLEEKRMAGNTELSAKTFCDAFVGSYNDIRNSFASKESWKEIWHRWNDLMLTRPDEDYRLPPGVTVSVLAKVAQKLDLRYPSERGSRQPMTLDGIFVERTKNNDPFPMRVAIEHENDWTGFDWEVKKLLSVRCLLKVGITYSDESPCGKEYRDQIAEKIQDDFDEIGLVIGEDAQTEYLFLVGAESDDKEISNWYSLDFQARTGPRNQRFQPVGQIERTAA
jgi:hypothetical protein